MDPLDPPQRFESAGALDRVLGLVAVAVLAVLWLRDPGNHLWQVLLAVFGIAELIVLVVRRAPRTGHRLGIAVIPLFLLGVIGYALWQNPSWLALVFAAVLVPTIVPRLGMLAYSFKHPELLDED